MNRRTMKTIGRPWVYGCSPFAASTPEQLDLHLRWARALAKQIWLDGFWPVLPHLYGPQFLEDTNPADRAIGLAWGLDLLDRCVALYVCDVTPSAGMQRELTRAQALDLPTHLWIPEDTVIDVEQILPDGKE